MSSIVKALPISLTAIAAAIFIIAPAYATSEKEKKVRGLMGQLLTLEKRIRSASNGLSAADLRGLKTRYSSRRDSDDDGIADMVETGRGWGSCDSDSDDDGLDDSREVDLGSKPDDSDSDDDGLDDSDEDSSGSDPTSVETTAIITAISSTQVTLGGVVYTLNANTKFRDDDGNTISKSTIEVGTCAEAEGNYNSNDVLIAHELKDKGASDDCS